MTLSVKNREYQGRADVVAEDKEAVARGLQAFLRSVRFDARFYGVTFDPDGEPNWEEVKRAAERCVMLQVQLDGPADTTPGDSSAEP